MSLNEAEKLAEVLITDGDPEYLKRYNMYDDIRNASNFFYNVSNFFDYDYYTLSTAFYNLFNGMYEFSFDEKRMCDNMISDLIFTKKLFRMNPYVEREKWNF